MSGGFMSENDPQYRFAGWRFYLNSYTKRGRFNVSVKAISTSFQEQAHRKYDHKTVYFFIFQWVLLTYGTIFAFVGLKKLTGGKKK